MWRTPNGVRHLQGPKAALLKEAIGVICDEIEEEIRHPDNGWECGIRILDGMEGRQKLALLASVSNALFRPDVPEPTLNAINEAVVAAIFESLPVNVEMEIDAETVDWSGRPKFDLRTWRRLIRAAFIADGVPADFEVPSEACCDKEEWDLLIECLAAQILWDEDWADEEIMDAEPDEAAFRKKRLGIDEDYYLAVAPDPTDTELDQARLTLKELVGGTTDS